jgi:electron transfer flavoprotein alpha subunit
MGRILVVAEAEGSKVREASLELVTLAQEVASATGWSVAGVVLGADPAAAARDLATRGGIPVVGVKDAQLGAYTADAWVAAVTALVAREKPELVLVSHGPTGWDWLPRAALRCDGSTASEITDIRAEGSVLHFTRKIFNAKLDMRFTLPKGPRFVTVQRGARSAAVAAQAGDVSEFAPGLPADIVRGVSMGIKQGPAGRLDLSQADIIVSGGRSLGGPEKFDIIRDLASALGGQVGASRPVTDAGWLPPEHQVGSSGVTVKPKLYIACGISGAIQHVVGMKASDYIIAINKDPRAPIFEVAHVGVVGDLFEIVPALTAAVKEAKGGG